MARTKQTARISTGGSRVPSKMQNTKDDSATSAAQSKKSKKDVPPLSPTVVKTSMGKSNVNHSDVSKTQHSDDKSNATKSSTAKEQAPHCPYKRILAKPFTNIKANAPLKRTRSRSKLESKYFLFLSLCTVYINVSRIQTE